MNYKSDLNYNNHLNIPSRSMHVAVLQMKGWRNDFSESKARLLEIVRDAGQKNVRIFVAPECVCSEYCFNSSEDLPSKVKKRNGCEVPMPCLNFPICAPRPVIG